MLRRSDHDIRGHAWTQTEHDDGRIVVHDVQIQRLDARQDARRHHLCRKLGRIVALHEIVHLILRPSGDRGHAPAGFGNTVAEQDQHVADIELESAFVQLLVLNEMRGIAVVLHLAAVEIHGAWIIILNGRDGLAGGLHDRECGVCQSPVLAHRERLGDRGHALIERNIALKHAREHRGREGGKDVCLHAASESVGEDDRFIPAVARHDALIAADRLAVFAAGHKADVPDQRFVAKLIIAHRHHPHPAESLPSARARRPSSPPRSRRGGSRSRERCEAACR